LINVGRWSRSARDELTAHSETSNWPCVQPVSRRQPCSWCLHFSGQFWCRNIQKMMLIAFLSAKHEMEDEKFRSTDKYYRSRGFSGKCFSFTAPYSQEISRNSQWIHSSMGTKIHILWQHGKIIWIHHFPGLSNILPTFHTLTLTISDRPTVTYCEGSNASQRCGSIRIVVSADNSGVSVFLRTWYRRYPPPAEAVSTWVKSAHGRME
jgi:hypothetical protein